jgi:hypothetical protein
MPRQWIRNAGILALVWLAGCSNSATCSDTAGPETVEVDASAFNGEPGVDVEVCILVGDKQTVDREKLCNEPGTPEVGLSFASGEYPAVVEYYVDLRSGSSHVIPGNGGGIFEMTCTATTTRIVLPIDD